MTNDQRNPGVLLGRPDGVIILLDAIPVAASFMADLNRTLDALGAPRAQLRVAEPHQPSGDETDDG